MAFPHCKLLSSSAIVLRSLRTWDLAPYILGDTAGIPQEPLPKALDRPRFRGLQHQSRLRALKLPDIEKRVALWNFFSTLCSSDIALRRLPTWDLVPYMHKGTVGTPQLSIS